MLEQLNIQFNTIMPLARSDSHYIVSNVAIAAAVTSYARITMIPFKINPHTLYTDTDSAYAYGNTSEPIHPSLIGLELGQMKDELKGQVIVPLAGSLFHWSKKIWLLYN
jgi:hypothetical protein